MVKQVISLGLGRSRKYIERFTVASFTMKANEKNFFLGQCAMHHVML